MIHYAKYFTIYHFSNLILQIARQMHLEFSFHRQKICQYCLLADSIILSPLNVEMISMKTRHCSQGEVEGAELE